jgi:Fic family protein
MDFTHLDQLKTEWDSLQPLGEDRERRLWRKFGLEWNFHSNHIEGNTLTYGETELLLLHGRAVGDHALREYEEMKAHDLGIAHLRALAADHQQPLTEGDLRDLNRIILKEPYWKAAETLSGQPTRKRIVPGEYKTTPNSVRTATDEIFEYASPQETPIRVAALVQWLRASLVAGSLHPLAIAAKLHHEFVLIHPFDDGNGRVARLLVNYVLLRCGYPPVIVRTEDKTNYLTALRKADAGELEALVAYLAGALERSLQLGLRAAKGESIDELSDTEKEVTLFVRGQKAAQGSESAPSKETIAQITKLSLKPFIKLVDAKLRTLAPLFSRMDVVVQDGFGSQTLHPIGLDDRVFALVELRQTLRFSFLYRAFQGGAPQPFDFGAEVALHFAPGRYSITYLDVNVSRPYSEPLLSEEAERLAVEILSRAFSQIKAMAGEPE